LSKFSLDLKIEAIHQYQMKQTSGYPEHLTKGNCYDNAVLENFFGIMKSEFFIFVNLKVQTTSSKNWHDTWITTITKASSQN